MLVRRPEKTCTGMAYRIEHADSGPGHAHLHNMAVISPSFCVNNRFSR